MARSAMETLRKALIVGALLGAGAGVGSALFVLVTPGEEKKQAMLKVGVTGVRGGAGGRRAPGWGVRTANLPTRRRYPSRTRGAGTRRPEPKS